MHVDVIECFGFILFFCVCVFFNISGMWKTLLFMQDYFQSTYKFLELSPHALIPMHGRVNLWPKHMLCGYLKYERQLFFLVLFFPSHHSILSMDLFLCGELPYYRISCFTLQLISQNFVKFLSCPYVHF